MCRTFTLVRENAKSLSFLLIALGFAATFNLKGAGYYVDFASGNDNNNGTSAAAAWMHCPGDSAALGISAATALKPGDKVFFKGGVTYQNPQIYCSDGSLVCTGSVASVSIGGVLTDTNVNFSTSGVQSGDLLYIYNGVTNGAFVDTCGAWTVTNVTSSTLTVQGFDAVPDLKHELTYLVCRPITFTTNANFGSGPAIMDGAGTAHWFFQFGNWNRFSGFRFQNPYDVVAGGCNNTSDAIFFLNTGGSFLGQFIDGCLFTNVYSAFSPVVDTLDYTVFQNNVVRDYSGFGLVAQFHTLAQNNLFTNGCGGVRNVGGFSIVRFNTVINMKTLCDNHSDCIGPFFSGSSNPFSNNYGWIYGNWCENGVQGIFLTFGSNPAGGTRGWTIANNVLCGHFGDPGNGPGSAGIFVEAAPETRIYNNLFLGTNSNIGWIGAINIGSRDYPGQFSTNVSVRNNIVYNPSAAYMMGAIHVYDTAYTNGFSSEGNVFYEPNFATDTLFAIDDNVTKTPLSFSQWQAQGFDKAGYSSIADPMILQPVGLFPADFNLLMATNSPALASPFSLPVNLRDAAKVLRIGGAAWDRGPYQITRTLRLSQPLGGLHVVPK